MKVRLIGTREERDAALGALADRFEVTNPAKVYPAAGRDQARVYVEATLKAPATKDGGR